MGEMHWGYLVPAGIAFLVGLYLSAVIHSIRAENASTKQLRVMMLAYGFAFSYLGVLAWVFDLSLGRYSDTGKLGSVVFIFAGVVFLIMAIVRSRSSLMKDADLLTKAPDEIDLTGEPDISPAARVQKLRGK